MSRIGKLAIKLDPKVKASVGSGAVAFEGPKGKMKVPLPPRITADVKDGQIHVQRPDDTREARSLHGLARSLLANAARGVASGWERKLDIRGVGFRAEVKGKQIHLALGFSHPTIGLTLRSANREALGETAVKLRALRPPEPYKGKGIKYADERVRRKEGKTGTA